MVTNLKFPERIISLLQKYEPAHLRKHERWVQQSGKQAFLDEYYEYSSS